MPNVVMFPKIYDPSLSWNPVVRLFLEGSLHYFFKRLGTDYVNCHNLHICLSAVAWMPSTGFDIIVIESDLDADPKADYCIIWQMAAQDMFCLEVLP